MGRLLCRRIIWLIIACCLSCTAGAQIKGDTLSGVEVKSKTITSGDAKAGFQPGAKIIGIDSALLRQYQQQSIATLLSQASSVFIKSYGFNSLATLSFRGASSAQSAVYWEGVPLMNGATGISDISLIPVAFSDSISILYGSNGAIGGSGNIGGALLLQSKQPAFASKPAWHGAAQIGWGSFGQIPASAEIGFTNSRFSVRARGLYIKADNNFSATDESGRTFNIEHAALAGEGILLEADYKADRHNVVSLHAWQQRYRRQIPRALFEASSVKQQDDDALRFLLQWTQIGTRVQMYGKAAYIQESYDYRDTSIGLTASAMTRHYFTEWGMQGRVSPSVRWFIFSPLQYMQLAGNEGQPHQTRVAIAGSLKKSFLEERLIIAANGRAESFDGKIIGLPGLGSSYHVSSSLTARVSVQRSYRAPTLNELYYNPGGNKSLKPENGWNIDGGYLFSKNIHSHLVLSHGVTAYNRQIRDWIIWLGSAIWTPHNLAAVHSRGLETENSLTGRISHTRWRLSLMAAYTRSTPTESYLTNDNSIGRQIPYTPATTGAGTAALTWRGASITYIQSYAGKRYIVADESAALTSYATGNLILSYTSKRAGPRIALNTSILNIWNNRYAVVASRPMPGRNYLINMAISKD